VRSGKDSGHTGSGLLPVWPESFPFAVPKVRLLPLKVQWRRFTSRCLRFAAHFSLLTSFFPNTTAPPCVLTKIAYS
jgi:hypothetical protein